MGTSSGIDPMMPLNALGTKGHPGEDDLVMGEFGNAGDSELIW